MEVESIQYVLLCLASFVQHIFKVYSFCYYLPKVCSFSVLKSIPLLGYATQCLSACAILVCLQRGAAMSKAAVDNCACPWGAYVFISLWKCLGTNEFYGKYLFLAVDVP